MFRNCTAAPPVADRWEIDKKHLSLGESLGKGAFGQVLRATLSHGSARSLRTVSNSSSSSSSSSSSVAAVGSSSDVDAEEMVVAVKLLLG